MSGFAELLPGTHPKTTQVVDVASLRKFPWPKRDVYVFGDGGPPVFALHELPGFTPQFTSFCRALAAERFTVYAPLLFGKVGDNAPGRHLAQAALSRDWYVLKDATPRIIDELRALADAIHAAHAGNMGAIGMCFTGQLPVALLDRPFIRAAVLSQPAMPWSGKDKLALDASDVATAKRSAVPMIAFRFKTDTICRVERQVRFETVFDGQIDFQPLPAGEKKHAVLTTELFDADGTMRTDVPSFQAFEKTRDYLRGRLSG